MTDSDLPLLVVVTGPPAAGKTTIAAELAAGLGLPLVAKDAIKEVLHDSLGGEGREWSRRLGVATFDVLFHVLGELLANGTSAVAEGNFARPERFLALPPARIFQVHVSAPAELIRERLATRDSRHPVHYDREVLDEIPARMRAGEWEPLELPGELVRIETSERVEVSSLLERL